MPQKEVPDTKTPNQPHAVGSAPELPAAVAKQFGLHHDGSTAASPSEQLPILEAVPIDDNAKTDSAVDDIVAKEGDTLLAVQDAVAAQDSVLRPRRGFWARIGHFFAAWWHNKLARWLTIIVLFTALMVVGFVPKSRYVVLNTVGVRSSASVVVLDDTTQLPLKNVSVSLDAQKVETDRNGVATFTGLKLGPRTLAIKRIAFASYEQHIVIGWGSNPLGSFKLRATGLQYVITVTDFVTGKPIANAEAVSDEVNALSDKSGKAVLTVADTNSTQLSVTISADSHRSEQLQLDANATVTSNVALVPSQKDVFVSNKSGKYDVFSIDLDGKNKKLLLAGTGSEGSTNSLVVNPAGDKAVLVSTRDPIRDDDGFLLQALTVIDLKEDTHVTVDHAEQIQLVDWIGDRLVYRLTLAGASAANSQRNRLVSYDFAANSRTQLATANQFNMIMSAQGNMYYAASSTDPHATLGLFKIKADGSGKKRLSQDEIWTGLRTGYGTFSLQTPDGWSAFDLKSEQISKAAAPANILTNTYSDNAKGDSSLWTEIRDGQGALLLHNVDKNTDKAIKSQDGLTYPFRWLSDDVIVYRIATNTETADYVIGKDGGTARKVTDLSPTYGYAQIY